MFWFKGNMQRKLPNPIGIGWTIEGNFPQEKLKFTLEHSGIDRTTTGSDVDLPQGKLFFSISILGKALSQKGGGLSIEQMRFMIRRERRIVGLFKADRIQDTLYTSVISSSWSSCGCWEKCIDSHAAYPDAEVPMGSGFYRINFTREERCHEISHHPNPAPIFGSLPTHPSRSVISVWTSLPPWRTWGSEYLELRKNILDCRLPEHRYSDIDKESAFPMCDTGGLCHIHVTHQRCVREECQ